MKRTYTISYKIPKGSSNLTPQGLKGIYEERKGNKRTREFKVEILSDKVFDEASINDELGEKLVESAKDFFTRPDLEWLSDHHYEATRIRNLFLYERNNVPIWNEIEAIITDFIKGLASETRDVEFGLLIPTVECVHNSLQAKISRFYDYFYWFNTLVRSIHGSSDLKVYLDGLYTQHYSSDPVIVSRVQDALLSLHNQYFALDDPQTFGQWFNSCRKTVGDGVLLEPFLQLLSDWCMGQLSDADDLEDWIRDFNIWKQKEYSLWNHIQTDPDLPTTMHDILGRFDALMLIKALELYQNQLTLMILEKPHTISEIASLTEKNKDVSETFQTICGSLVSKYYQGICELNLRPVVGATLICDFAQRTLNGQVGESNLFQASWGQFLDENVSVAKALGELAARSMENQKYQYVNIIAELLEMNKSDDFDGDLAPFSEAFSESLWRNVCELSCRQFGDNKINRYIHGINILRVNTPQVVWQAGAYLKLVETQPILNQEYWPSEVEYEINVPETEKITQDYQEKYPHRIVKWDLSHSYGEVQLNGRTIRCTYPAFQIMDLLSRTPGYGVSIGTLDIPQGLLENALKELISEQHVFYVPATKLRKFEDKDMIYLTYK